MTRHLERYDLGEGARTLYDFIWSELCDWYIEVIKPRLYGKEGEASKASARSPVVRAQRDAGAPSSLHAVRHRGAVAAPARHRGVHHDRALAHARRRAAGPQAEPRWTMLMEVIKAIRNIRAEKTVPPGPGGLRGLPRGPLGERGAGGQPRVRQDAGQGGRGDGRSRRRRQAGKAATAVTPGVEIFLPLARPGGPRGQELARLNKELEEVTAELERARARLANPGFVEKAPAHVVEGAGARVRELEATEEEARTPGLAELS